MDHLGDHWPFTASRLSFLTLLGTRGSQPGDSCQCLKFLVATVYLGGATGI